MALKVARVFVALLLVTAPSAYAATQHVVGDSSGWTNFGTDYSTWASDKTFTVGDSLVFSYGGSHSVAEATESDYNSCSTSNLLKTYDGGSTTIPLTKTGPMYFICPSAGHCGGGMKLAITVVDATSTPGTTPSPPSSTPGSGTPTTTPTTTTTPPPPPPRENGAARIDNVVIGSFVALLAAIVAFL